TISGGVGIYLPSNIIINGEGFNTVFTSSIAIPGSPTANDYFVMFMNNNTTTQNNNIIIRNIYVNLPSPSQSSTGLQAWDDAGIFYGVNNCVVENCYFNNGGIEFK